MLVETFKVMANVAQLVEPRFVVPVVVGSSPIVRPMLELCESGVFLCLQSGSKDCFISISF